jgi:hypothetical protein
MVAYGSQDEQPQFSDSMRPRGVDSSMYDTRRRFYAVFCGIMSFRNPRGIANSIIRLSITSHNHFGMNAMGCDIISASGWMSKKQFNDTKSCKSPRETAMFKASIKGT